MTTYAAARTMSSSGPASALDGERGERGESDQRQRVRPVGCGGSPSGRRPRATRARAKRRGWPAHRRARCAFAAFVTGHRCGWPQACGSHRRQVRSAARRESIRRASSVAQMRSSAARSSASSASTSARRIESRAVAISLASAHPESVSVTCTVRRSAVPRARVTCPSASSRSTRRTTREWLSPRLPASRSIGLPDAKAASAASAAARPPGPEADAAVAASTSRASASTTAPSTFAVCCAAESMPGAYNPRAGSVPATWSARSPHRPSPPTRRR